MLCMKVLIVDDELGIRELLSELVNDFGHYNKTATNGEEALTLCERDFYSSGWFHHKPTKYL